MAEEAASGSVALERVRKLSELTPTLIGKYVNLHGWIYSTRTQGAGSLVFMDLGDGTTVSPVRCIAQRETEDSADAADATANEHSYGSKKDLLGEADNDQANYSRLSFEEMTQANSLSIGCSVMVLGFVAEPPEGTTQTFEIKVLDLFLIGGVADPSKYPIQKSILKKPLALRSNYHSRFRAPLMQQLMLIRSQALFAVHEFFHMENIPLLDPNIMTSSDCEGAGEVFKVTPQFFHSVPKPEAPKRKKKGAEGEEEAEKEEEAAAPEPVNSEVGLTVSSQLPLEAIAMGTGSVYTCQKSFRAEKSETNKHLAEFLHIEYEQYFITLDDLLCFTERYVKHVVKTVLERCQEQYKFLDGKATSPPEFHGHREYLLSLLDKPLI